MAEKEFVHLDKDNSCPECGRDFGRGATHCDRCTIDEALDPLVAAAAQQLTEATSFSTVLYDVLPKVRGLHPGEQLQVAAAIVSHTKRKMRDLRPSEGVDTKLEVIERNLDKLANELI